MKKGDKLYCIKSIVHSYNNVIYYIKNKTYEIIEVNDKCRTIKVSNELNDDDHSWEFNIRYQELNVYKFSDHFLTQQQYRKQKLKKINETRR